MKNAFHYSRRAADLSYPNLSYPQLNHQEEAGYILITYSCLISMALIIFAAGYLRFQENQVHLVEREICSIKAFYIAQAGLQMIAKNSTNTPLNGPFDGGQYTGTITQNPNNLHIRVTGTYGMNDGSVVVSRTLEATKKQGAKTLFEGAVYTHTAPYFACINGTIDGKHSSYSIRSGEEIPRELKKMCGITLSDPNVPWKPRSDYNTIIFGLRDGYSHNIADYDNNKNFGAAKNPSQQGTLLINGGKNGTYIYTVDSVGTILKAELSVTGQYELPGGNYYLTQITIEKNVILTTSGPVKIYCYKGTIDIKTGAQVKGYQDQSNNFAIEGYGIQQIQIAEDCRFIGTVLAPGCNFIFHDGAQLTGAILVGGFNLNLSPTGKRPWFIEFDDALNQGQNSPLTNWQEIHDA